MLIVWHLLAVLAIQPVLPSVSPSKVVPSDLAAAIIQPKKKYRPKDPSRKFRYRALVAATGKTLLYFGLGTLVWGALYGIILSIQGWKWGITGIGWGYMFAGLIVIGACTPDIACRLDRMDDQLIHSPVQARPVRPAI